ncbi:hypothetical protein M405DRAFT_804184 [Rhizopogon salebrosus TDB-379]|nr:hypothetical protein M405DRAFT_804184 [Rhizopogon salebrosus TDB-379]
MSELVVDDENARSAKAGRVLHTPESEFHCGCTHSHARTPGVGTHPLTCMLRTVPARPTRLRAHSHAHRQRQRQRRPTLPPLRSPYSLTHTHAKDRSSKNTPNDCPRAYAHAHSQSCSHRSRCSLY